MNRRKIIQSIVGLTGITALAGGYAWQIEPFWLEFVGLEMPIDNLPKHLEGKKLMQISDIHVGKRFDHRYLIESFEKASELMPDFVVYTGDYVSTYKDEVQYKELKEVLKYSLKGSVGTVGILGNHDYGRNWSQQGVADNISELLIANGITILRNQQIKVEGLNIIGLDDYWGSNFKPDAVMNEYDQTEANIILSHNPDVCDLDVWNNYRGWILAGHTHGGQCKPPFLPPPMLPVKNKKYTAGKIDLSEGRTLYINRALGHLWQVRFNVRPEITIFTLKNTTAAK
jgi:uncharacterized protein